MITHNQPDSTGGFRVRQGKKATTWTKSDKPNLLKNVKSGKFYGRFILAGKPKWINLETTSHHVACLRLNDARQEVDRLRQARQDVTGGEATMGQLANLLLESLEERDDLKPKSKEAIQQAIAALRKTYPRFENLSPTAIKKASVIAWRNRIRKEGTGYRSAFGKGERVKHLDGSSTSLINKMIAALKDMLAIAIDRGQLVSNPLMQRGVRLPQKAKKPELPEAEQIEKVLEEMEEKSWGNNLFPAELCRFIAYSGARKSEANRARWRDVNWEKGFIRLFGTKSKTSDREVPLIPAMRQHLLTLWERRQRMAVLQGGPNAKPSQNDPILKCKSALITLATACESVGVERLTHHDLRDAFTTACVEGGIAIPTVAEWLGHADGGVLLMKVYHHVRKRHSHSEASRVAFGVTDSAGDTKDGTVVPFKDPAKPDSAAVKLAAVAKALGMPEGSKPEDITTALAAAMDTSSLRKKSAK